MTATGLLGLEYSGGSVPPSLISCGVGPTTGGNGTVAEFPYGTKELHTSPPESSHVPRAAAAAVRTRLE